MPSSNEIRNIQFSAAKNGYSRDEVDVLLDAVEEDYVKFEAESQRLRASVENLTRELENVKSSQNSIQTVLVRAQELADDIVAKAKIEAEKILEESKAKTDLAEKKAREAILEIEQQAVVNRRNAEAEIEKMKAEALETSEAMITSAKDSVARQQIQFEAIKAEVVAFKEQMKEIYRQHVEIISQIPEEVSNNAIEAASAVEKILAEARAAAKIIEPEAEEEIPEEEPDDEEVEETSEETLEETDVEDIFGEGMPEEEPVEKKEEVTEEIIPKDLGFKVTIPEEYVIDNDTEDDDEDEEEEEKRGFSSSKFFRRR